MTRWKLFDRLAIALVGSAMALAACASPGSEPLAPSFGKEPRATAGALATCDPMPREVARVTVGSDGGVVSTSGARIIIPKGALSEDVEFTLTQVGDKSNTIEVSPSGIQLDDQIRIQISYKNCDPSPTGTHRIVALDDNYNELGEVDSTDDPVAKQVTNTSAVLHSRYAVAW